MNQRLHMESDSENSDDELREAFARGDLKPGLNVAIDTEKTRVNNVVSTICLVLDYCSHLTSKFIHDFRVECMKSWKKLT